MSITWAEYWLLETAVELRIPLCCLVDPDIEGLFNKPGHGLDKERLIRLLESLLEGGDIVVFTPANTPFMPTESLLRQSLVHVPFRNRRDPITYGLTAQGGARWEAAAHADWSRYISHLSGLATTAESEPCIWEVEIACSSKSRLLEYHRLRQQTGKYRVLAHSEAWQTLVPWKVTHWKTLPVGHLLRFRCLEYPPNSAAGPETIRKQEEKLLREMYHWFSPPSGLGPVE